MSHSVEVSVVMPLYNAAPYFRNSVESVLRQTYKNWELIVVDDCSTDGSGEEALELSKRDPRIHYLRNAVNSGVAFSRNVALERAVGRFVAFLDSDDEWLEDKLERQLDFAVRKSSAITYCSYFRVSEAGNELGVVRPKKRVFYKDMLFRNHIGNLTAMYDRARLPSLRFKSVGHEDYLFWVEAIAEVGFAELVPSEAPLARYLVRRASLSGNKLKAAKWQWLNYRKNIGLGYLQSMFYFCCYALGSVLRKL
ncbi:glycosyltransferase family 2 protein [Pseudomonas sp. Rh2]|uniref:glycosyltransferase family 2 protein n=1 Tax=unclassified Pseudomonas TaxID=196821 RepID=UPI00345DB18F